MPRSSNSQSELLREIARHELTLKELTKAKDEADRASNAKSEFLAKMSHELRTPLNAVIGYSEILLEDAELDGRGEQISDLQKISAAGKHLLSMVNDILDISKIEAGKMDLFLEDFDLDELHRRGGDHQPAAGRQEHQSAGHRPRIDPAGQRASRLHQAAAGRCSTWSATPPSSRTTARSRCASGAHATATAIGSQIAVMDTGVGISLEQQKVLFSKFTQANAEGRVQVRRHRPRPVAQPEPVPRHGRRHHGREPAGAGLLLHHPSAGRGPASTSPRQARTMPWWRGARRSARARRRLCRPLGEPAALQAEAAHPGRRRRSLVPGAGRASPAEGRVQRHLQQLPEVGRQLARTAQPDAILLDILMPDFDGWAVLEFAEARSGHGQHSGRDPEHRRREEAGARSRRGGDRRQARRSRRAAEGNRGRVRAAGAEIKAQPVVTGLPSPDATRTEEGSGEMPVVLVVEDNPINRDVLGRRLEKRGYSVRFAEDGPSGIEAAAKLRARPHPDGHRARARRWTGGRRRGCIKADPETAGIPIIALTASAFESDRRKSLAAGCCDFDTKPVDLPRLLSKIEQSLRAVVEAGRSRR